MCAGSSTSGKLSIPLKVNLYDGRGETPLGLALWTEQFDVARQLLEAGVWWEHVCGGSFCRCGGSMCVVGTGVGVVGACVGVVGACVGVVGTGVWWEQVCCGSSAGVM